MKPKRDKGSTGFQIDFSIGKEIGTLVGYDCGNCGGYGFEEMTYQKFSRDGKVEMHSAGKQECDVCFGAGSLTNGKPDVYWDTGITDPSDGLRMKWGNDEDYDKEVNKGRASVERRGGLW